MRYLLADQDHDATLLRRSIRAAASDPVIPGRRDRKRTIRQDTNRYPNRHLTENAFCRFKNF